MVFSQTSQKSQSILKVVEVNRVNLGKDQNENDMTGKVVRPKVESSPASPAATTSYSEDYLKPEPLFEKMFHEDSEYFQELDRYIIDSAKGEQSPIIDTSKNEEYRTHYTNTYTPISPSGWETYGATSPTTQLGFYYATPNSLSPTLNEVNQYDPQFDYPVLPSNEKSIQFQDNEIDINSLPVVFGDISSELIDSNQSNNMAGSVDYNNSYIENTSHSNVQFLQHEDTTDLLTQIVTPQQIENDVIISEVIINDAEKLNYGGNKFNRAKGLVLDVTSTVQQNWLNDVISTPDVLNCVEQLEKNTDYIDLESVSEWTATEMNHELAPSDVCAQPTIVVPTVMDYDTVKIKSDSEPESDEEYKPPKKRKHLNSEDSDETYSPKFDRVCTKKYKKKRSNVPIEDRILELKESQPISHPRRGRPPKRRDSTVSSICSDSASTTSTQSKYRELRDKNNEASKRSRMNRKLKELQMQQIAIELEEKNNNLKIKAQTLEEVTKKLKDALMSTILNK